MNKLIYFVALVPFFISIHCSWHSTNINTETIFYWNNKNIEIIDHMGGPEHFPPMAESRLQAMLNLALHNVINTIDPKYPRYYFSENGFESSCADAAIVQANCDILRHELPNLEAAIDSINHSELNKCKNGYSKDRGILLGHLVAKSMLELRNNDLSGRAQYPIEVGNIPGNYRYTPPFDGPPFNTPPYKGFVDLPGWGEVKPFTMTSGSQFRSDINPFPLNSELYAQDYIEIKTYGCKECPLRNADQTEYAIFWKESSVLGWNRIALTIAKEKKMDAHELSRLLALLHVAIADSYISSLDGKIYFNFWRPITAVHFADIDDNPQTAKDENWIELGFPTPPIADYPSAHACAGGAAAEILKFFFKTDSVVFETVSRTLPGVNRTFKSFSEAAKENSLSRIYIGYHFRHAVDVGEKEGQNVGRYVADNLFKT